MKNPKTKHDFAALFLCFVIGFHVDAAPRPRLLLHLRCGQNRGLAAWRTLMKNPKTKHDSAALFLCFVIGFHISAAPRAETVPRWRPGQNRGSHCLRRADANFHDKTRCRGPILVFCCENSRRRRAQVKIAFTRATRPKPRASGLAHADEESEDKTRFRGPILVFCCENSRRRRACSKPSVLALPPAWDSFGPWPCRCREILRQNTMRRPCSCVLL